MQLYSWMVGMWVCVCACMRVGKREDGCLKLSLSTSHEVLDQQTTARSALSPHFDRFGRYGNKSTNEIRQISIHSCRMHELPFCISSSLPPSLMKAMQTELLWMLCTLRSLSQLRKPELRKTPTVWGCYQQTYPDFIPEGPITVMILVRKQIVPLTWWETLYLAIIAILYENLSQLEKTVWDKSYHKSRRNTRGNCLITMVSTGSNQQDQYSSVISYEWVHFI